MTKILTNSLYLFCLLLLFPLFGYSQQLENNLIEKIDVVFHAASGSIFDSKPILARMSTKQGGFFSQADFDEDLKTLATDFDRIEPTVEVIDDKVYITLNIWPKPIIRSLEWHGNKQVLTRRLQRELGIKCFEAYERQEFNKAFHKIKAYYMRKGFFEAEIDYQVVPNIDTNEVDIIIEINEGRSGKIQKIVFVNFDEQEEHEILQDMITKKYNIFMSWITQEGTYNEDAIQQDQLIITNYLQNEGYADAQVDISVAESPKTNRIIVTITADRGEPYFFGCLSFEGNKIISDEIIDRLFTIRRGDPYSLESIRETIDLLTEAYGRLGYIDAIIDFDSKLVDGENLYDLHFKIEEGEQYRVGLIRVFGNTVTKTPVILHETLLIPGEIFNSIKLKKTEERLQNIGYFKNVNVYIVKGTESSSLPGNYRDVYIEVEETSTGQFSAFVGYSSVEEIFGGINITERNFNHEGFYYLKRDGLKALRGGGEFVNATAQIGQKSSSYVLSWTKPYFMDTKWTIGFDLSNSCQRYISKEYDLETIGLNLRAHYNINQFVRLGFHYRLKNGFVFLHTHEEESEARHYHDYRELEGLHDLRREAHIHGLISAVGTSLSYDSTNHPIKPSKGFRSRFSLEFAGVGGDHTFLNAGYFNCYYLSVGSRSIIKYRADFRFIQPIGSTHYSTMPLDERIFLGGEFTVRGFRPYRLGPQYEGTHIPRGGLSMQLYSIEMNRRIIEDLEAFVFFDAAHLSKETWNFGRLSLSIGYGIKFKLISSIPPLTIGMGYPLNPRNRSEVKKFFLSVGGNF
ncbi:MAG: outer membrane protein assembly factor BamA [Parachlamydiaceae bacterium]|nr:outer membrane protein assembly factor BamA [Parachlamydiaceae bacterium]